ncbi:MAG: TonB-dependent receptor [Edaphocola sp.]
MRNLLSLLLCVIVGSQVFALGKVAGTVTDGSSGETLIGVSVTLYPKGSETAASGTLSDIDGNFLFEVPTGEYELEVKYVGYSTKRIADVTVKENELTKVAVALDERKNTQLDEVVIQSSVKKESVNALYSLQKNAVAVSDGISADVIRKSPDRSTGEVLKRVSGTAIQDGKFVIVRGMSDRYNTALVDNAVLPSTEPNRKAFSFDIIPATMIDNIVITKAGTPDLPGDFAGGVINILTKEIPEENTASLSIGTGYNSASTFKNFKSGYRAGTDFLGFDDGSRKLPSDLPSAKNLQNSSFLNPNKPEQSIPYLNMLNNNFEVKEHSALPAVNLQGSLGRSYRFDNGHKFGANAAITYNHSENIKPDIMRQYDNFDYLDNSYNYATNLGALLNLGYFTTKSKYTLKTLYNRIFDDNFLYRTGYNNSSDRDIEYYAFDLVQKSLFKTTLGGDHQLGKGQSKVDWLASYNYITNDQPDQRKVAYSRTHGSADAFGADLYSLGKSNSRLYSKLKETILNANVNYGTPVNLFSKSTFKAGAFAQYRYRDFANRYLGAVLESDFDDVRFRPIGTLFASDAINDGAYTLKDQTDQTADAYTATAITSGAYLMMDSKIGENFRAVYGLRLENYKITLDDNANNRLVNNNWLDFLPSLNLTYSLNEKSNLRASYFRSVARPELRELANLSYYDYDLSAVFKGNPNLKRSRIDNFDLRYEWYPRAGEVLSASVFYKHFNKTIENYVYAANSSYEINPTNYDKARNIGVEIEVRKKLDFLSDNRIVRNLSFYVNAAWISSKVSVPDSSLFIRGEMVASRKLSGQSPYMVNASLGYTSESGKFSANLLYNVIGQRLYMVGQDRISDVYESPRNLLDLQASYSVSKRSEFRLNIKDLINNRVFFYFDQERDGKYGGVDFADGQINTDKDWILQSYRPGRTISFTYSYKF